MPNAQRSSGWRTLRFKAADCVSVLLMGGIALLLLLFPAIAQSICLNKAFIAASSALIEPAERSHQYDGCLPGGSQLLAGDRGRLRLFQMNLAFVGPEAAEVVLSELSPESSESRLAHIKLGQAYLLAGDGDAAIAIWSRVDARPQLVGAGNAAFEDGDHQRAVKFWEAARALWRQNGLHTKAEREQAQKVLGDLAQVWTENGAFHLAADAYAEAAQLAPPHLDAYIRAGKTYATAGDWEEAKRWFEAASEIWPTSAHPYCQLGLVFGAEGQWDRAASYFETAVDLDPSGHSAWQWLGTAYERLGHYDLAYDAYTRLQELLPRDPYSYTRLAGVSSKMGEWELAIGYYREAMKLLPQRASEFWLEIGRAYGHLGQQASACEAFRQALKLSPESQVAQQALDAAGCGSE